MRRSVSFITSFHIMSSNTLNLDRFRSTRTRIAKPVPSTPSSYSERSNSRSHKVSTSSMQSHPKPQPQPKSESSNIVDIDTVCDWGIHFKSISHPLRVIFIGHNPSDQSWALRAPYAHKSNRFWRLLSDAKLAPSELCNDPPTTHSQFPSQLGIGFIDLFVTPGSDASTVHGAGNWHHQFIQRLLQHTNGKAPIVLACVSKIVAKKFLGKHVDISSFGCVGTVKKLPLPLLIKQKEWSNTQVWVLPSTSGRAVISAENRLAPFVELAEMLKDIPWPPVEQADHRCSMFE